MKARSEIDELVRQAQVCRVAFARGDEPYLVPLFYGYDGARLYFHTAREGKKLEFIAANSRVCFEVEGEVRIVPDAAKACEWTACFASVIGYGRVVELLTPEDKARGLNEIMRHYSGREWSYEPASLKSTRVWCIEIESVTGKRSDPRAN